MSRYRPYYSNMRSRSSGNQRAADQQRDICQVVLKSKVVRAGGQNYICIIPDAPLEDDSWIDSGTIALNIYDVLMRAEFFKNYSNMYDQVRIDQVKVDITPSIWATSKDENNLPGYSIPKSLTLVTAWDRTGLDDSQFIQSPIHGNNYYCVIGKDIESYSSAVTKHLGSGNMFNVQRYIFPNTNQEREQFISVRDLRKQFTQSLADSYVYRLENGMQVERWRPNCIFSDPAVRFKPTLLVSVRSPYPTTHGPETYWYDGPEQHEIGYNQLLPTVFTFEFAITVTFRGLRVNKNIS